ncbi:MAG TPA: enoyl-CoA hydratase family protein [Acidimicrobiia bacterium]|nr:enoyl-CoA hydratase family protein [Acidimicrobiia bacterium]
MAFRGSTSPRDDWKHFHFSTSEEGIASIVFSRPEKLNALTFEVYADLRDLLVELPQREVRVLTITGEGRGFCSGGDVREIIGALQVMPSKDLLEFTRMTGMVVQRMRELPIPIVAGVNGIAAGAGAVIALAADLRLLGRDASFHFLFTRVGLAGADMGAAYLLPRVVGLGRAAELLLLGEPIGSEEAERIGLGRRSEDLASELVTVSRSLSSGPGWAIGATKSLLARELDMSLSAAIELEAWTQALLMTSDDHREFYRAFTEKQDPSWRGT